MQLAADGAALDASALLPCLGTPESALTGCRLGLCSARMQEWRCLACAVLPEWHHIGFASSVRVLKLPEAENMRGLGWVMSVKRRSGMLRRHGCCLSLVSLRAGLRQGMPFRMPCFPLPFLRRGLASVCIHRTSDVCWNSAQLRLRAVTPPRSRRANSLASAPVGRAGRRPGCRARPASYTLLPRPQRSPVLTTPGVHCLQPRHVTPRHALSRRVAAPRSRRLARAARQQRAPSLPAQVAERPARARARACRLRWQPVCAGASLPCMLLLAAVCLCTAGWAAYRLLILRPG